MTRSRAAAVAGACALSGAAAVWLNLDGQPPITDATASPGLLELIASAAATARPDSALAGLLSAWHLVAVVLSAVFVSFATWQLTRSVVAMTAVGLIVAASPLMTPTLGPPGMTAIAVTAAAASAILGGRLVAAVAGLAIAGAIAPTLILPNAVLSWWFARRRTPRVSQPRAMAAAAISIALAGAARFALPDLPGSESAAPAFLAMLPDITAARVALDAVVAAAVAVGTLGLALAALGIFSVVDEARASSGTPHGERLFLLIGFPLAACIAALGPRADSVRTLAPLIVAIWLLISLGLTKLLQVPTVRWRGAGGVAVAVVLVAIHADPKIHPGPRASELAPPLGHEALTRSHFQQLLYQLPSGAALIDEDAVTDVLLRSLSASLQRSRNGITAVPSSADGVAAAFRRGRVFALPRTQLKLQTRGIRFAGVEAMSISGIAEVVAVAPCTVLTTAWQTAPSSAGVTRLAMVAANDEARGPIVIYAGGPEAISTTPVGWPPLALRGFYTRSYERAVPAQKEGLLHEAGSDVLPPDDAALNSPFVMRTELWRVPGAPRSLAFDLSAPPSVVVATQFARGTGPMRLCPVFPFDVRGFR